MGGHRLQEIVSPSSQSVVSATAEAKKFELSAFSIGVSAFGHPSGGGGLYTQHTLRTHQPSIGGGGAGGGGGSSYQTTHGEHFANQTSLMSSNILRGDKMLDRHGTGNSSLPYTNTNSRGVTPMPHTQSDHLTNVNTINLKQQPSLSIGALAETERSLYENEVGGIHNHNNNDSGNRNHNDDDDDDHDDDDNDNGDDENGDSNGNENYNANTHIHRNIPPPRMHSMTDGMLVGGQNSIENVTSVKEMKGGGKLNTGAIAQNSEQIKRQRIEMIRKATERMERSEAREGRGIHGQQITEMEISALQPSDMKPVESMVNTGNLNNEMMQLQDMNLGVMPVINTESNNNMGMDNLSNNYKDNKSNLIDSTMSLIQTLEINDTFITSDLRQNVEINLYLGNKNQQNMKIKIKDIENNLNMINDLKLDTFIIQGKYFMAQGFEKGELNTMYVCMCVCVCGFKCCVCEIYFANLEIKSDFQLC